MSTFPDIPDGATIRIAAGPEPMGRLRNRTTGETTEWRPWRAGEVHTVPAGWRVADTQFERSSIDPDCETAVLTKDDPR